MEHRQGPCEDVLPLDQMMQLSSLPLERPRVPAKGAEAPDGPSRANCIADLYEHGSWTGSSRSRGPTK